MFDFSAHDPPPSRTALHTLGAGYLDACRAARTHEAAADVWCRLMVHGRIVERLSDGSARPYTTRAVLVEHPDLAPGEVYAVILFGDGAGSVYRTTPDVLRAAMRDPSIFNFG